MGAMIVFQFGWPTNLIALVICSLRDYYEYSPHGDIDPWEYILFPAAMAIQDVILLHIWNLIQRHNAKVKKNGG